VNLHGYSLFQDEEFDIDPSVERYLTVGGSFLLQMNYDVQVRTTIVALLLSVTPSFV